MTLREKRMAKGVGLSDMARILGITRARLSAYELGQRTPTPTSLIPTIAKAYGMKPSQLATEFAAAARERKGKLDLTPVLAPTS
jgi:transcriptional regulator with XRE-family HTH domain